MESKEVLEIATKHLLSLQKHEFDLLNISKPISPEAALNLAKVISKLSPLLGNLIEFNSVEFLNSKNDFADWGRWKRQDPDFPDALFEGKVVPLPGVEIKAWFPLATEITARLKESQNHFTDGRTATCVCMLAWLPQHLIYGKPYILDVVVVDGLSVTKSRDDHYHNPPDYLVIEPEDTKSRTRNLQQTNTSGYKFQGSSSAKFNEEFDEARKVVESWGPDGKNYQPTAAYQQKLTDLRNRFRYRQDTNYPKMDRIAHPGIEEFKKKVYETTVNGMTIANWRKLFASVKEKRPRDGESAAKKAKAVEQLAKSREKLKAALAEHLAIKEEGAEQLLA